MPPELAGRDEVREAVRVALARVRKGRAAKATLLIGLRGVGKTVLLDRLRRDAESEGHVTVRLESPEERSLPSILVPGLRIALLRLRRTAAATALAERALRALAGFIGALKVKYQDLEVGLEF